MKKKCIDKESINNVLQTLELWYNKPAENSWEMETLPIGNGSLGATIYGGIEKETLVLNEKTLWTGGPSDSRPNYIGGNKQNNSYEYVHKVQQSLAIGDNETAVSLLNNLTGLSDGYGAYQLLCDVNFEFESIFENSISNYKRFLNLNNSTSGVQFNCDGVIYTREYFANHPSNVIAIKFTASEAGKLNFTTSLNDTQKDSIIRTTKDCLFYYGALKDNQLRYESQLKFICKDGIITNNEDTVIVTNATEVVIFISAATDYENVYPHYRSGIDPHNVVSKTIHNAIVKGYEALYQEHIDDYVMLFGRVKLSLGDKIPNIPTDDLMKLYKEQLEAVTDSEAFKRYLEVLYFQYGRYLLIASSRDGSLPANLQGIWNNNNSPPWSCDYHINVNLQMNYWPAYVTNIAETAIPLIDYIEGLRAPGRITAAEYYNIVSDDKNPKNGWTAHTQSTPFGWTCPGWDFYWGWSTAAAAWLIQNIWEYYEFTSDINYLRNSIYPIMRESVVFYTQWLIYDENQDRLVSSPSYSPEHGPVTIGNTYEQSLIEQLFSDFIQASQILGVDSELRQNAIEIQAQLKPYAISDKTGFIKEWFEEDDDNFDAAKVEKHHRHLSHLLGLYPGKAINYGTPYLLDAAIKSMNDRGDEATGWARAYKLNLWARVGDGNRAYSIFKGLIQKCTYNNLWDTHPPFQIDGNFGGTAGIAEMLLQSHMGYIKVLPSLPTTWSKGSYQGLCARNGFEVDCAWNENKLNKLSLLSRTGSECRIQIGHCRVFRSDGSEVQRDWQDGILVFKTTTGARYYIDIT